MPRRKIKLSKEQRSIINKRNALKRTTSSFSKISQARKKWYLDGNKPQFKSKICLKCKKEYKPSNSRQYYCGSIKQKIGCSYKTMRERDIGYWLAREYQITFEDFKELFKKQDGKCKICGLTQDIKRLAIDHDHKTKKIRGLLCDKCNRGLGHFNDDISMLELAIKYLKGTL